MVTIFDIDYKNKRHLTLAMPLFRPKQQHNVQLLKSPDKQGEMGVSLDNIKPLIKLLNQQGVKLDALLNGTDIQLHELANAQLMLSFNQLLQIIKNADQLSTEKNHALLLGQQFFINHDGPLSLRILSSTNTREAMTLLCKYQNLFSQVLDLSFVETPDYGVFRIEEKIPLGEALPYFIEYTFSALYSIGLFCLGETSLPLKFELTHPAQGREVSFKTFFNQAVNFDSIENRVIFPKDVLDKPIIFHDAQQAEKNDVTCQQYIKQVNKEVELIRKVKQAMSKIEFTQLTLDSLATELHMSPRTLRRHLSAQGISYKGLLENERKRQALEKIQHLDHSIETIAFQLGYQNTSSFSRAFKRWFGVAPNHYTQQQRH